MSEPIKIEVQYTINWREIGKKLACCDAYDQANFVSGFIERLETFNSLFDAETQGRYVHLGLSCEEKSNERLRAFVASMLGVDYDD
jgi:hypothetical protein